MIFIDYFLIYIDYFLFYISRKYSGFVIYQFDMCALFVKHAMKTRTSYFECCIWNVSKRFIRIIT